MGELGGVYGNEIYGRADAGSDEVRAMRGYIEIWENAGSYIKTWGSAGGYIRIWGNVGGYFKPWDGTVLTVPLRVEYVSVI